jgi:fumarate reductase subunit C
MSRQPFVRPVSRTTWYLRNGRYRRYMLREVTCLLVGFYSILMIWALAVLASGSPERWEAFLAGQQTLLMKSVHGAALIYFLAYMTFDWFKLAPKAMALGFGGRTVSPRAIILAHYVVWVLLTLFVFWLVGVF